MQCCIVKWCVNALLQFWSISSRIIMIVMDIWSIISVICTKKKGLTLVCKGEANDCKNRSRLFEPELKFSFLVCWVLFAHAGHNLCAVSWYAFIGEVAGGKQNVLQNGNSNFEQRLSDIEPRKQIGKEHEWQKMYACSVACWGENDMHKRLLFPITCEIEWLQRIL